MQNTTSPTQNTTRAIEEWDKIKDFIKNKSPITTEIVTQITHLRPEFITLRPTRLLLNLQRHPLQTLIDLDAPINIITEVISKSNINKKDNSKFTPLQAAIRANEWKIATIFLENGADVNAVRDQGITALYMTCMYSNPPNEQPRKAILTQLITSHTINLATKHGDMPLHIAASRKNELFTSTLLDYGADVNVQGSHNRTPLHYALSPYYATTLTPKTLSRLISTENIKMQDDWNEPPLFAACRFEYQYPLQMDIFTQLILPHNINLTNKFDDTPLHIAALYTGDTFIPTLLEHGADINLQGSWKGTALHYYISSYRPVNNDTISRLISPSNINIVGPRERSALQTAIHFKLHSTALFLLKRGADPSTVMEFRMELSLSDLCIITIRRAMRVISNETLATLPLPRQIIEQMDMHNIVDRFAHYLKTPTLPIYLDNSEDSDN